MGEGLDVAANLHLAQRILGAMLRFQNRSGSMLVQHLTAPPGEPAVYFDLVTDDGQTRVRLGNVDPSAEAFVRAKSVQLAHQADAPPSPRLREALRLLREVVEARDPGGLSFVRVGVRRGPNLFLVRSAADERQHRWSREVFDAALERLLTRSKGPYPLVIAVVSQPCTLRCTFCPQVDRDKARDDWMEKGDAQQLGDLVYQLERAFTLAGGRQVDIGGNDVLAYARILELAEEAQRIGYKSIVVQSPGLVLAERAFAEAVAASPITDVSIPIYGSDAATHDAITGTPGSFDQLMQALEHLRALGRPRAQLHSIALASTFERLGGLIEFCRERLGRHLFVTPLRPNRLGEREHLGDVARFDRIRELARTYPTHFLGDFPWCANPWVTREDRAKLGLPVPRRVRVYDLGMPGQEHERVVRDRSGLFPDEVCARCLRRDECPGVLGAYLDRFGTGDLLPFA
jgi:uncharacterized Fe-S cluster-containing radical SAM superfamily protein